MQNSGILEWFNENSAGYYPLSKSISVKELLIDASFIQFDGFIPVLKQIQIVDSTVIITIQFDLITLTSTVAAVDYYYGYLIRWYSGTRYLGTTILGDGFTTLLNSFSVQTINVNTAFAANTVCSVPSSSGVYSLGGAFGDINFDHLGGLDQTVKYEIGEADAELGNFVKFNAGSMGVQGVQVTPILKTINGIAPILNSLQVESSEILKVTPNNGELTFSLATSVLNDKIVPQRRYA